MVLDQSSQDWWIWEPKFNVWALKDVQMSLCFTHIKRRKKYNNNFVYEQKLISWNIMGETWV